MTDVMSGIFEFIRSLGYAPEHIPDNDYCNETVKWSWRGRKMEIELGGPGCSGGAPPGWVVLMYRGGGNRYELADPACFDKIAAHLARLP